MHFIQYVVANLVRFGRSDGVHRVQPESKGSNHSPTQKNQRYIESRHECCALHSSSGVGIILCVGMDRIQKTYSALSLKLSNKIQGRRSQTSAPRQTNFILGRNVQSTNTILSVLQSIEWPSNTLEPRRNLYRNYCIDPSRSSSL